MNAIFQEGNKLRVNTQKYYSASNYSHHSQCRSKHMVESAQSRKKKCPKDKSGRLEFPNSLELQTRQFSPSQMKTETRM